ncbi:MAG: prolyl oligopeptidase family serine peptidase [Kineosporiaceae bacterium]
MNHTQGPPPVAAREDRVREVHGDRVVDPYAWMSDHDDPRLPAYLEAERAYYEQSTAHLAGRQAQLAATLRARLPRVSTSCPWWFGGYRYQLDHPDGAEYPRLLRRLATAADGEEQVLLDVTAEAGDAAYAELGLIEVSDDGRLLAYSIDLTGDEVYELRFRDLGTGADLPDRLPRTYYGGAWTADSAAFYYTVHDEAYRPHQVWRHRLGTPVEADVLVHAEPDRRFEIEPRRTRSGDYVVISAMSRTTRQELILDAHDPGASVRPLRPRRAGVEDVVEHHRTAAVDRWLLVSNDGADEFRLLESPCAASESEWTELIAGRPGQRLEGCAAFAGGVVLSWRAEAQPVLGLLGGSGQLRAGSPAATIRLGPNHDYDAPGVVVETTSLIDPSVWARVPFDGGTWHEVHRAEAPGHDASRYLTERIALPARDGTPIPVTLAYAASTARDGVHDGTAPGLLYGYGAYECCEWPEFAEALPVWLDQGLVYAVAHVRGGGEGGRSWWQQGRLRAKATTFTDHIDVADGLVARGWVAPDRLATRGLSAGGLLQGAVLAMRPDRWAAVVAEVPFVDCVNSMLDADLPLTVNEWEEWGDPRDPDDYAAMRAYTPYENLPVPPWPPLLVTGALHDPRVLVHEPAKWVAALRAVQAVQAVQADGAVPLFRAETGPGAHSGPSGRFAAMDYEAEVMAFVLDALRVGQV